MTKSLQWWRDALKGNFDKRNANFEDPQPGLYRVPGRDGAPYRPVHYWYDDVGILHCVLGKHDDPELDEDRAKKLWQWACEHPITTAEYKAVAHDGKDWSDVDSTVAAQQRERIGGNNPPTDPAELLKEQIDSATAGADAYAEIKNDQTAKKAQTLRSRLTGLAGESEKTRKALKQPFLDGCDAVDAKWMPLTKAAQAASNVIREALKAWETKKYKKAQAEAAEAQIAAAKAQAEIAKAQAEGKPAPWVPPAPPHEPYVPTAVKGAAGRAASVKPRRVVTAITNIDALFTCLKNRPEVAALFLQLAQKIVDANQDVLGVTIETQMSVK